MLFQGDASDIWRMPFISELSTHSTVMILFVGSSPWRWVLPALQPFTWAELTSVYVSGSPLPQSEWKKCMLFLLHILIWFSGNYPKLDDNKFTYFHHYRNYTCIHYNIYPLTHRSWLLSLHSGPFYGGWLQLFHFYSWRTSFWNWGPEAIYL